MKVFFGKEFTTCLGGSGGRRRIVNWLFFFSGSRGFSKYYSRPREEKPTFSFENKRNGCE